MAFELPTLTVEIAFGSLPTEESPTWSDVSFLLRSFSITRGRQYALGRYEAGTARIRLDNRERRFDPAYEGEIVNLITNPSFELATTGYGAEFGSIARSSSAGVPYIGSWGLVATTTNVIYSGFRFDPTPVLSVTAGLWYTFSAYIRLASAGSKAMAIWISWFDVDDNLISEDHTAFTLNSTTYARFQVSAVAPANSSYVLLYILTDSAGLGVFDFWADALQFEDLYAETRNLIINPSFETNTTGYFGSDGSIARSNAAGVPYIGSWGLVVTTTNAIYSGVGYAPTPNLGDPLTPDAQYCFSAYVRLASAGSKAMAMWISWYDIDDNFLSENAAPFTLNSTTYARFEISATAPSDAAYATLFIFTDAAALGVFDFWVDALQFEPADTAGTYHDGAQTNGAWSGTAHASTSLYSAVTVTDYADGDQTNCAWTGDDHDSTTLRGGRYFGRLLPMKKIRISATYDAITYRLFTGYIDGWPQSWPGSKDGIVEVAATDGFKVLSLVRISGVIKAVEDVTDNGSGAIQIRSRAHTLSTGDAITIYGVEGATEANAAWQVTVIDDDTLDLDSSTFGETYLSGGTITQYPQERAGDRIDRVLDAVNWPAADRNIDQGISTIQPSGLERVFALEHLQLVELSENGRLFMENDGTVRFVERHDSYLSTSQFTFTGAHYHDPVVDYDDTQIWNEITVTRAAEPVPEGRLAPPTPVPQANSDQASQDAYFTRSMDVTGIIVPSDNEAQNYADFRLANYKEPALRISSITVSPARLPAVLWPQVLGRTLGERVTVTIPPPAGGDDISQESFIEGIDIDYAANPRHFDVVYRMSAIGIGYQLHAASKTVFIVGTSSLTTGSGVLVY